MVHFTDEEVKAYRAKKVDEKKRAKEAADEADAEATKERREQARIDLEERVKTAFLDSGGTVREYSRMKTTLVEQALVAEATRPVEPEPKPEKPRAGAPLPKRIYRDMGDSSGFKESN